MNTTYKDKWLDMVEDFARLRWNLKGSEEDKRLADAQQELCALIEIAAERQARAAAWRAQA